MMSDLISRQKALKAMETWDKFGCDPDGKLVRYDDDKHYIPYVHYEDMVHAIKHIPSAQSVARDTNVLSNDLIIRQAAIDQLHQSYNLLDAERRLEDMPSAQPTISCDHENDTSSAQPEPCKDAVSRADVEIEIANILRHVFVEYKDIAKKAAAKLPSVTPEQRWIPIKVRPMDDEERKEWSERIGYDIEYEEAVMFDCPMPDDGQEVWVCSKCGNVWQDTCQIDEGLYLEENGDWLDIVAWMPFDKPEPFRREGDQ